MSDACFTTGRVLEYGVVRTRLLRVPRALCEVYELSEKLFDFHSTTLQYMLNDKRSLRDSMNVYIS